MRRLQIFFNNDTTMLTLSDEKADDLLDRFERWHNYEPGILTARPIRVVRLVDEDGNQILIDLAAVELLYAYTNPDDKLEHVKTHEG